MLGRDSGLLVPEGSSGADGPRKLVVCREPFHLRLDKRAPGIRLSLPIVGVSFAELKLPAIIMGKTKKGGDPVVRQLQCPVVESIHRPKMSRQLVVDAQERRRCKIAVARPGEQPDDHLSVGCMLHVHERVVVVAGEFRTDHHGRYFTRLRRWLESERFVIPRSAILVRKGTP